jgi:1-phosphofructokinase family hexose kinase
MSLWILNPNPVFDRTITIEELVPGAVLRTLDVEITAGGKGINVARVLRSLGNRAPLIIPVGREDAKRYERLLASEGAEANLVEVAGSIRTASIYLEQNSPRITVVNDAGTPMSIGDWERAVDFVMSKVQPADILLCMGSFPPGLESSVLARLVERVHGAGARILIDVNPQLLAAALPSRPDVVTPNLEEAEAALTGAGTHTMDAAVDNPKAIRLRAELTAKELCRRGAVHSFVTAGAQGVAFASVDQEHWLPGCQIDLVSTVGAGDSFVGGLASKWGEAVAAGSDVDWWNAASFGIATSASSCEQVLAGGIDPVRVVQLHTSMLGEARI